MTYDEKLRTLAELSQRKVVLRDLLTEVDCSIASLMGNWLDSENMQNTPDPFVDLVAVIGRGKKKSKKEKERFLWTLCCNACWTTISNNRAKKCPHCGSKNITKDKVYL
jgi:hypothetical protein